MGLYIWYSALAAVLAALSSSLKIVPNTSEYLVERFGVHVRTLGSGPHFIIPVIERVAHKIDLIEHVLRPTIQSVATKNHIDMALVVWIFRRVVDSKKAAYKIENLDAAIEALVEDALQSACGKMTYQEVKSNRERITAHVTERLSTECSDWGVVIREVAIRTITIDQRARDALISETVAEARAEASRQQTNAEAYQVKTQAEADAHALRVFSEETHLDAQAVTQFWLRRKYLTQSPIIAQMGNVKNITIPDVLSVEMIPPPDEKADKKS